MKDSIVYKIIPGRGIKVVFVLGWGMKLEDACVLWFIKESSKNNWDLIIFEIPNCIESFSDLLSQIQKKDSSQYRF
ncbi:MAG: hypothetical protein PHZ07_02065 [Patescibacteria group bacterium]|nr:hypothetical protein [Patescibacteria group bacterium]MDD4304030.1 hypothetical protein [Patescibacteria group bacterium]MDD4694907.1 hypothetical protein [Patescibacteria group bacterium]